MNVISSVLSFFGSSFCRWTLYSTGALYTYMRRVIRCMLPCKPLHRTTNEIKDAKPCAALTLPSQSRMPAVTRTHLRTYARMHALTHARTHTHTWRTRSPSSMSWHDTCEAEREREKREKRERERERERE